MWMQVAQVALKVIGGSIAAGAEHIKALNQGTLQQQEREDAYVDNLAVNKTVQETNLQNSIRTGYKIGMLNVQRGEARKRATAMGTNLGKQKLQALGAESANAAASGSVGASVDAIASDIEMTAEQSDASIEKDLAATEYNQNAEMHSILEGGEDALQAAVTTRLRAITAPKKRSSSSVIMEALVGTASEYASGQMSLGLGNKATPNAQNVTPRST
jgi:hypothetical protein